MTLRELESLKAALEPSKGTEFIQAVRSASMNPGVNSLLLVSFVDKVLKGFEEESRRICSATRSMTAEDRENLTLYGRIAAAQVILLQKCNSAKELRRRILILLEYCSALVRTKYDFLTTALRVVNYPVVETGLDWKLVEDATSLDLISYRLIEDITFKMDKPEPLTFTGKGRVVCRDGVLSVCSSDVLEGGAKAFAVCGDDVEVVTRNVRDEKLKASDQSDVEALGVFAETFRKTQEAYSAPRSNKRAYAAGDKVNIMITGLAEDGETLLAKVVDTDADIRGEVDNETLIAGVETGVLRQYLFEEDCIRGAILKQDDKGWFFSISDTYTEYSKKMAEADYKNGVVFQARAVAIYKDWGRIVWMTPSGYCGLSRLELTPDVKVGDTAIKTVINIQKKNKETYINVDAPWASYEKLQLLGSDEGVLEKFVTDSNTVFRTTESVEAVKEDLADRETVRILSSILFSTAHRGSAIDAYRHLLAAFFLAVATEDKDAVEAIDADAFYLRVKLLFACGGKIPTVIPAGLSAEEKGVVELLARWNTDKCDLLDKAVSYPEGSGAREIASLLLGLRISSAYKDEVKADTEAVRRRICALLGVGDAYTAGEVSRKGKYGRAEGHEVEFKSSYVFRNDNGAPDLDHQGRGQVFEAVCAFLNADGGTLYLGVNDGGDPILASGYGLDADMKWLSANHMTVNSQRFRQLGHAVTKADTIDHYVLFLNSEKELYFKESLLGNITIEATEDADAIRFVVKPAEYEIAYLYRNKSREKGIAYVRDGGRTVPMTRVQKEQRLAGLKRLSKEVGFVVTIQEAIDEHRKLIFKDYSSGNSGKVKDRFVVPVNLFYNDENVYCYDLEAHSYKQFRLHRIGSIETDMDNPVYTLPIEAPKTVDVFRWLESDRSYHVRLRMGAAARNYFLEEYSMAQYLPKDEFFQEDDQHWILDTRVNGIGAVRRFYLGLADRVEILESEDSEELKAEIDKFVKENIVGED